MSARSLLLWSLAALVCLLDSTNPIERLVVVLIAVNVLLAGRREDASLRLTLLGCALAGLMTVALVMLESHSGSDVLVTLPGWLPLIGGVVTLEALGYGGDMALGVLGSLLVAAPLALCVEPDDLLGCLPRRLERTAAAVGTALTLAPRFARSVVAIRESETLRRGESAVAGWRGVATPALLSALEDSMDLAEAMDARGFGSGPRTAPEGSGWRRGDLVVGACCLAAAVTVLVRGFTGELMPWTPFPTLYWPALDPVALLATLLLLAPLVQRLR